MIYALWILVLIGEYLFWSRTTRTTARRLNYLESRYSRDLNYIFRMHRINDQKWVDDTAKMTHATIAGFEASDKRHEELSGAVDIHTKRINDAWAHLLRLEGRIEATPTTLAADDGSLADVAADFAELTVRVKTLELAMDQIIAKKGRKRV